jgi:hypothetical protein
MPWYKAGTVSVVLNSTTVTGTGTAFAANCRVGDAFLGPDGRWYEVANVASDTVISILPAYQGVNVDAGAYALAPMQGYVKDSADQLRALVNKFGTLAAAASINALATVTGAADKLPYFTAADAIALATLTAQGRTFLAANSQANQRTALGLGSAALAQLVGTVSQSGGVPNGAVFESGTTASGSYTKYADGTLVCSGISTNSMVTNTPGGNVFHSASVTFTFPAQFVGAVPKITHGSLTTVNYYSWTAMEGGIAANLTSTTLRLVSPVNSAIGYICYVARGRWY